MRCIATMLILLAFTAGAARADDMADCKARQAELAKQAASYTGDARTRRLIEFDLKSAAKEQSENDAADCLEALDHAAKLLAGAF